VIDGDLPKIDKAKSYEKQRTFFEAHGAVFLNDAYEKFLIKVWSRSLTPAGMGGLRVEPLVVYQYAKDEGMNKSDVFDIIKTIHEGVRFGKRT